MSVRKFESFHLIRTDLGFHDGKMGDIYISASSGLLRTSALVTGPQTTGQASLPDRRHSPHNDPALSDKVLPPFKPLVNIVCPGLHFNKQPHCTGATALSAPAH